MIEPMEFQLNEGMRCPVMGGEPCMGNHCALAVKAFKHEVINGHDTYAHWRCGLVRLDSYDEPQKIGFNG